MILAVFYVRRQQARITHGIHQCTRVDAELLRDEAPRHAPYVTPAGGAAPRRSSPSSVCFSERSSPDCRFLGAFSTPSDGNRGLENPPRLITETFSLNAYVTIFTDPEKMRFFLNSYIITLSVVACTLCL